MDCREMDRTDEVVDCEALPGIQYAPDGHAVYGRILPGGASAAANIEWDMRRRRKGWRPGGTRWSKRGRGFVWNAFNMEFRRSIWTRKCWFRREYSWIVEA